MSRWRPWTQEDLNFVRDNYQSTGLKELAKTLGRTINSIQKKARKLGVRKVVTHAQLKCVWKQPWPVGSTRVDRNGYTLIKFGKRDWRLLQRVKWEEYYGEPPAGTVSFRDGNRANVEKSNLYLTSPREQLKSNTANNLPEGLKELVHIKGRLTFMINKRREE